MVAVGLGMTEPARWSGVFTYEDAPLNVYWEMTTACDLACRHCRADAVSARDPQELTTEEGKALIRDIRELGSHLILTGGDPLKRADVFELIEYARSIGVPVAITPAVTPRLTREIVERFKSVGVAAMGISLDGSNAARHDGFRNVAGTFDATMRVLEWARDVKLPVQINTTVCGETLDDLPAIYQLLRDHPAVRRWSLFILIPVGRGLLLGAPTAPQIEGVFKWVYETSVDAPFHMSTVEAPHYRRYWVERKRSEGTPLVELQRRGRAMGFGVRDGSGIIFVSHRGEVFPAGFLPYPPLGNVRQTPLTKIYREATAIRDVDALHGKCGTCEYRAICGGSRARAYASSGDPMGSDPLCIHAM